MLKFKYNDGGREKAGYKGMVGDCLARAVTIYTRGNYKTIYRALYADFRKKNRRKYWERVLEEEFGLFYTRFRLGHWPTLSEAYAEYGDCIMQINTHCFAIRNGTMHDTYDYRLLVDNETERKTKGVWQRKKPTRSKPRKA